ncbi:MAG TPA: C1 family peptidase, partial [Gemmatimonadales bacterium]|nr:C1 family peptidase [Gemmatimonadales bacterium]
MRIKRYGWVRDIPDQRDFRYVPPPRLARALPPKVDLRGGFPPCYNQGELGSCTANAIAGALQFLETKEGASAPVMPSRLFVYYNERALEGSVASDSGAQIRDGIKSVAKRGFCSEEMWPYDIRKFADKPPEPCYRAALKDRVSQYLRLDHTAIAQLLTCLASGFPFVFGFSVYESFESPRVAANGVVPMPRMGERVLGGHAVVACGYDLKASRFTVRNSWGGRWGMNGYFTMPFAYLTSS